MRRRPTVLLALVLTVAAGVASRPLRATALTLFRFPLIAIQRVVTTLAWLPQLPTLTRENAELRRTLAAQQLDRLRLQETVRHLTTAQHASRAFSDSRGVAASIIGRSLIPTEQTVLLDRGAREGIVPDSVVVAADGLVGRILEAHSATSVVLLVTDPDSRVACVVERSREYALLVGTGEPLGQLTYLSLDADVEVGDRIVTAGIGGIFPKGVSIGTAVKVSRDARRALTRVWVRPAVTLNQLEEVLCLPPVS